MLMLSKDRVIIYGYAKTGWIVILVLLLLALFPLVFLPAAGAPAEIEVRLDLTNSYRVDNLNWNIAGDQYGNNPDILSELTWTDLKIYQLKAGAEVFINNFSLQGSLAFGWILKGDNQDSDYSGDNRTGEYSRSNNSTDGDNVLDASVGLGYRFISWSGRIGITPLAGLSYHKQNLRITDGYQTIPATGSFPGLNSTYQARWMGPWIGVDLSLTLGDKLTFFGSFAYHRADYYAQADWNLRTDFAHPISYTHEANAAGFVLSAELEYLLAGSWSLKVGLDYQRWYTGAGIDKTYWAAGVISVTRLNEVNWNSLAVSLGTAFNF